MFWHEFKYSFLSCFRTKEVLLWLILFPIFLGTIFKVAFANIGSDNFSAVDIAVVEISENRAFNTVINGIADSDDPLFNVIRTDSDDALDLLEKGEISGIIYVDEKISMSVSGIINGTTTDIKKTIVKTFVEQYNATQAIIVDTVMNNPEKLPDVIAAISENVQCNENIPLTNGNTNNMLAYFHNLIAMVAFLGSNVGIYVAIDLQANLSAKGARISCSPTNKLIVITANLLSKFAEQAISVIITITYLLLVLKIDLGDNIPLVYLSGIIGGTVGVSFGFFIGSFGKMSESAKAALATAIPLVSCFFSGLMINNMKAVVAMTAPWFNEINPAAVISDTFYCLTIYDDYERFTQKIITMLIMTAVFTAGGFLLTRRRRYASL